MHARTACGLALFTCLANGLAAQTSVRGFGSYRFDSSLTQATNYVAVSAGHGNGLERRSDGTIVAWGLDSRGQCEVPAAGPGLSYIDMSCGHGHALALRSDFQVVGWGWNSAGDCNPPPLPPSTICLDVAAGSSFSLARRSDGEVLRIGHCYPRAAHGHHRARQESRRPGRLSRRLRADRAQRRRRHAGRRWHGQGLAVRARRR